MAFDWANLVGVCQAHHPGQHRGEPSPEAGGSYYCHTIQHGVMGSPVVVHEHGGPYPMWHKAYKEGAWKPPADRDRSPWIATTTAVGDAALDRALAESD